MKLPFTVPEPIAEAGAGRGWSRERRGMAGADVLRIEGGLVLKSLRRDARDPVFGSLVAERDRLLWCADRLPAPRLVAFASDETRDHVLMTEISGTPAASAFARAEPSALVPALGEACRLLRSVSVESCPFDQTLERLLEQAELRVARGLVDPATFDAAHRGRSARELYDEARALASPAAEVGFVHGDLCLPNVIIRDGRVAGFVDLGAAGKGDRHRDVALCYRSTCKSYGAAWGEVFLRACAPEADRQRIELHLLLDELF